MSEIDISVKNDLQKRDIELDPESNKIIVPLEQMAARPEKSTEPVSPLGFPDFFLEYRSKSGMERKSDWNRAMAAEIKSILSHLDEDIEIALKNGYKEMQVMRVGSELVRPGSYGRLPQTQAPSMNDRQRAVFEALKEQPGIETEMKKDANNVYWIVARHKKSQ